MHLYCTAKEVLEMRLLPRVLMSEDDVLLFYYFFIDEIPLIAIFKLVTVVVRVVILVDMCEVGHDCAGR
jgi:hypothetical protein